MTVRQGRRRPLCVEMRHMRQRTSGVVAFSCREETVCGVGTPSVHSTTRSGLQTHLQAIPVEEHLPFGACERSFLALPDIAEALELLKESPCGHHAQGITVAASAPSPAGPATNSTEKKKVPHGPLDHPPSPWDMNNLTSAEDAINMLMESLSANPQAVLSDWGVLFGWIANQSYAPAPAPCAPKAAPAGTPGKPLAPGPAPKDGGAKAPHTEALAARGSGERLDGSARSHAPGPAPVLESIPREQLMSSFFAFVQNRAQEADYRTVHTLARLMRAANLGDDGPEDDSAGAVGFVLRTRGALSLPAWDWRSRPVLFLYVVQSKKPCRAEGASPDRAGFGTCPCVEEPMSPCFSSNVATSTS